MVEFYGPSIPYRLYYRFSTDILGPKKKSIPVFLFVLMIRNWHLTIIISLTSFQLKHKYAYIAVKCNEPVNGYNVIEPFQCLLDTNTVLYGLYPKNVKYQLTTNLEQTAIHYLKLQNFPFLEHLSLYVTHFL